MIFRISGTIACIQSWLSSQNDCNNGFTMVVLRYVYPSDNQKSPKNAFIFFNPYTKSFPITRNICHIKLSDL